MEEAIITKQANTPPAPPRPQVPIPVPNDKIIKDNVITFDDVGTSDFSDSLSTSGGGADGESDKVVDSPTTPPRIVRIVEATAPDAAQKANIKAEVTVQMLVNTSGEVDEVRIINVRRFDLEDKPQNLPDIGYGISEATKEAALQWKFHPARNNGKKVRSYSKQLFTFGF